MFVWSSELLSLYSDPSYGRRSPTVKPEKSDAGAKQISDKDESSQKQTDKNKTGSSKGTQDGHGRNISSPTFDERRNAFQTGEHTNRGNQKGDLRKDEEGNEDFTFFYQGDSSNQLKNNNPSARQAEGKSLKTNNKKSLGKPAENEKQRSQEDRQDRLKNQQDQTYRKKYGPDHKTDLKLIKGQGVVPAQKERGSNLHYGEERRQRQNVNERPESERFREGNDSVQAPKQEVISNNQSLSSAGVIQNNEADNPQSDAMSRSYPSQEDRRDQKKMPEEIPIGNVRQRVAAFQQQNAGLQGPVRRFDKKYENNRQGISGKEPKGKGSGQDQGGTFAQESVDETDDSGIMTQGNSDGGWLDEQDTFQTGTKEHSSHQDKGAVLEPDYESDDPGPLSQVQSDSVTRRKRSKHKTARRDRRPSLEPIYETDDTMSLETDAWSDDYLAHHTGSKVHASPHDKKALESISETDDTGTDAWLDDYFKKLEPTEESDEFIDLQSDFRSSKRRRKHQRKPSYQVSKPWDDYLVLGRDHWSPSSKYDKTQPHDLQYRTGLSPFDRFPDKNVDYVFHSLRWKPAYHDFYSPLVPNKINGSSSDPYTFEGITFFEDHKPKGKLHRVKGHDISDALLQNRNNVHTKNDKNFYLRDGSYKQKEPHKNHILKSFRGTLTNGLLGKQRRYDSGEKKNVRPGAPSEPNEYNFNYKRRGLFIIINNKNFHPNTGQQTREGTDVDAERLEERFQDLGFEVKRYDDVTRSKMSTLMYDAASYDHSDADCFGCAILSHGFEGRVYAIDGYISLEVLVMPLKGDKCPALVGKPKLFFVQACRGSRLDYGVDVSDCSVSSKDDDEIDASNSVNIRKIPIEADFLFAYSTVPGYYSWRNNQDGSWFIQALCIVLENYGMKMELLHMLTHVNRIVAYEFASCTDREFTDKMKQMPCVVSMLTRYVYFRHKKQDIR